MPEFDASIIGCELPVSFGMVFVAVLFPSRDFGGKGWLIGNAAIKALG